METMELDFVSFNEKGEIFLNGEQIKNVSYYKLENSAAQPEQAELTVTMYVTMCKSNFESQKQ